MEAKLQQPKPSKKMMGPEMELCLKSIHGITIAVSAEEKEKKKKKDQLTSEGPPAAADEGVRSDAKTILVSPTRRSLRATVAFTGSSSSMQVSSATMCGRTGHLIIESGVLQDDPEGFSLLVGREDEGQSQTETEAEQQEEASVTQKIHNTSASTNTTVTRLVATFQDPAELKRIQRQQQQQQQRSSSSFSDAASQVTSSSSRSQAAPHLRLQLPPLDPSIPTMSLQEVNDTTSASSSSSWSPTGTVLPEQVELNISIKDEEDPTTILAEGQARLRLFQQEAPTIAQLDLPIVMGRGMSTTTTSRDNVVSFDGKAYVRVEVCIETMEAKLKRHSIEEATGTDLDRTPSLTLTDPGSEDSKKQPQADDDDDEDEDIRVLLARFKAAGAHHATSSKNNPLMDSDPEAGKKDEKRRGFSSFFCAVEAVRPSLQGFVELMKRCEGHRRNTGKNYETAAGPWAQSYEDQAREMGITPSMATSTIATRESLNI